MVKVAVVDCSKQSPARPPVWFLIHFTRISLDFFSFAPKWWVIVFSMCLWNAPVVVCVVEFFSFCKWDRQTKFYSHFSFSFRSLQHHPADFIGTIWCQGQDYAHGQRRHSLCVRQVWGKVQENEWIA